MKTVLVGERKVLFWWGEKYVFKRVARFEWECISHSSMIPKQLIEDLGE